MCYCTQCTTTTDKQEVGGEKGSVAFLSCYQRYRYGPANIWACTLYPVPCTLYQRYRYGPANIWACTLRPLDIDTAYCVTSTL